MTQIRFDGCDLSPRSRAPRFAQRIGLLALLAALLLAGCGGGGRLSKTDYERTMNDAGRNLSQVFGTIDQGTTNSNQLAVRVTRARRTLERVRTKLADVKPPKSAAKAHAELVVALGTLSADLQGLARAAAANDQASVQEARAALAAPGRQLVSAIQQLQQAGYAVNNG